MLTLHSLTSASGSRPSKKRIGRGLSSKGTYAGRGVKGQRARSGGRSGLQLKGMRNILLAIPKHRGFKRSIELAEAVNLAAVAGVFNDGAIVTPELLKQKGLIRRTIGVKLLKASELTKKFTVKGCRVTKGAREQIEKAGGQIVEV